MVDQFEFKKYLYYGLIGVISAVTLIFFPLIGSKADLNFSLPDTLSGWLIYIVTRLLVAILNMLIFYCFMEQAKLNVRNNENYKIAINIMNNVKNKEIKPRSPKKWTSQQYSTKGISLLIMTLISSVALTNAILSYDYISLLTYLIVLIFGILFGIIQMKYAESYWTNEFYQYAMLYNENKNKINKIKEKIKCSYTIKKNIAILKNKSDRIRKISNTSLKKKVFLISSV